MFTAFHVYGIHTLICIVGFIIFVWWWKKTGRATEVYRYFTILFAAQAVEKGIFTYLRWMAQYGHDNGMEVHRKIVTHPLWPLVAVPTTVVFGIIVVAMIIRIYKTNKALKIPLRSTAPIGGVERRVLIISAVEATHKLTSQIFEPNKVECYHAKTALEGLEILISYRDIPVVLIGLSSIEQSELSQDQLVMMIKAENPWAIVVAISRMPNLYELFETRRAFFDDYLYLPVDAIIVMKRYERWIERVNRWRQIDLTDRRKNPGRIRDRKNIKQRCDDCVVRKNVRKTDNP